MNSWIQALAAALLLSLSPSAVAWSAPVHELICEMTWLQLTPAAKRFVRSVRAGDRNDSGSFARSCAWADSVRDSEHRDSYEYHFVNLTRGANGFDPARDCAAFDCLPLAVHRYLRYVIAPAGGGRMQERRARALRFVGHFIADLHQPLHVAYAEDRGGNDIQVQLQDKRDNLHALFDGELPAAAGVADVSAAARLVAAIPAQRASSWQQGDVAQWANESFTLARDRAYPVARDGRIDAAEQQALLPILREQVQKSSVRLAWVLNEAAAGRFVLKPLF